MFAVSGAQNKLAHSHKLHWAEIPCQ